jgi:hypothetical protein
MHRVSPYHITRPSPVAAIVRLACAWLLGVPVIATAAGNAPETHSLFLSAMSGEQVFDASVALENDHYAGVGMGFRFNDRHSLELAAGRTDTQTAAATPADADTLRADALWHYFRGAVWQPYLISGIGQDEYSSGGRNARGTSVSTGGGVFRHLAGPFHLRGELRLQYSLDDNAWSGMGTLGITCAFGGRYTGSVIAQPGSAETETTP